MGIGNVVVDRRVYREARRIDRPRTVFELLAIEVDLEQVARRHLAVVQAEGVDQELLLTTGHAVGQAQRDVVVDHLGPPQQREDAVAGGQLDSGSPLVGMHQGLEHSIHQNLLAIDGAESALPARGCRPLTGRTAQPRPGWVSLPP